jgi:hypothetical protein
MIKPASRTNSTRRNKHLRKDSNLTALKRDTTRGDHMNRSLIGALLSIGVLSVGCQQQKPQTPKAPGGYVLLHSFGAFGSQKTYERPNLPIELSGGFPQGFSFHRALPTAAPTYPNDEQNLQPAPQQEFESAIADGSVFCASETMSGSFSQPNVQQEIHLGYLCKESVIKGAAHQQRQSKPLLLLVEQGTPKLALRVEGYTSFVSSVDINQDGQQEILFVSSNRMGDIDAFIVSLAESGATLVKDFSRVYWVKRYPTPLPSGLRATKKTPDEKHFMEIYYKPGEAPSFHQISRTEPL